MPKKLVAKKPAAEKPAAEKPATEKHAPEVGQSVVPGDFLTTAEEYSPGVNTAELQDGRIVSTCVGRAGYDSSAREVKVGCATKPFAALERGSIVVGVVSRVRDTMVMVEMETAEKNGEKRVIASSFASIPVRLISREYVKDARDEFRAGDIFRARAENVFKYGIDLSTDAPDLGVIKAYCCKCRSPLLRFGASLKCTRCGSTETRKIARDYALK